MATCRFETAELIKFTQHDLFVGGGLGIGAVVVSITIFKSVSRDHAGGLP